MFKYATHAVEPCSESLASFYPSPALSNLPQTPTTGSDLLSRRTAGVLGIFVPPAASTGAYPTLSRDVEANEFLPFSRRLFRRRVRPSESRLLRPPCFDPCRLHRGDPQRRPHPLTSSPSDRTIRCGRRAVILGLAARVAQDGCQPCPTPSRGCACSSSLAFSQLQAHPFTSSSQSRRSLRRRNFQRSNPSSPNSHTTAPRSRISPPPARCALSCSLTSSSR